MPLLRTIRNEGVRLLLCRPEPSGGSKDVLDSLPSA